MKTPIENIKHKHLSQPSRYAYYSSLEASQQQELLQHYQTLDKPSTQEKGVIRAIGKTYDIFNSDGSLYLELKHEIKKHLRIDIELSREPKKDSKDYFQEELEDILHVEKVDEFINNLPNQYHPWMIKIANVEAVRIRNKEVLKLRSVINKDKDASTSEQKRKYEYAKSLIQEIQRDEGTVEISSIPSYDELLIGGKKIIPKYVRVNYEREIANGIANFFRNTIGVDDATGEVAKAYSELFWIELKRNDTETITLASIEVAIVDALRSELGVNIFDTYNGNILPMITAISEAIKQVLKIK